MGGFNVLYLSSEVDPFSKTGGLGDVASALPKELSKKGLNVKVITPLYSSIDYNKHKLKRIREVCKVHMGNCEEYFSLHHSDAYGVDVYFIEFHKYFNREGLYGDKNGGYQDNAYRFIFFCRAAMAVCKDLNFWPSIVHSSDWQTGFINYAIKRSWDPFWHGVKTIFSIHNMGHQGTYGGDVLPYAGVDMRDWHSDGLETFHRLNLLKTGIVYADKISTVSPNYAKEILTPEFGEGLDYYLNKRSWDLVGILNGIDVEDWNPVEKDDIAKNYGVRTYRSGKKACKRALQERFDLEVRPDVPIFSGVWRLTKQKGVHAVADVIRPMVENMDMQIIIAGTPNADDDWVGNFFGDLPKAYGGKIGSYIGYNDGLGREIFSGSDFFMMPSLYEPCGLSQMEAQAYGALPVVHGVGGLEDTIENYDEDKGKGTGFKYYSPDPSALYNTCAWAVSTYFDRPKHIDNMVKQCMKKDVSWSSSADEYIKLYNWAMWG